MILYVNGDSHAAAAEAVNPHAFANDDIRFVAQGRRPHPDNLQASWGMHLSRLLGLGLKCDAESASSNDRIIRTTNDFLATRRQMGNPYTVIVIGWSTWEREEWYDDESREWVQVTGSGTDHVPEKWKSRYKQWVATGDYRKAESEAHAKIWELHQRLKQENIDHLFFNAMWHFKFVDKLDWEGCYMDPYDPEGSYLEWGKINRFNHTNWHYGPEAHRRWAELLAKRLTPLLTSV